MRDYLAFFDKALFSEAEPSFRTRELSERYALFFGAGRQNRGFDLAPDIIVAANTNDQTMTGIAAGSPVKNES